MKHKHNLSVHDCFMTEYNSELNSGTLKNDQHLYYLAIGDIFIQPQFAHQIIGLKTFSRYK